MTQVLTLLLTLSVQPTAANDLFVARGTGNETAARVFDHNVLGPAIQVGLLGHAVRGRAWGAKTDLVWDGERVRGQLGGSRVDLKYREDVSGRLIIDGTFAGGTIHLDVSPTAINGRMGERRLALTGEGGVFTSEGFEIDIPQALNAREAGERAAMLPLLLAGVTHATRPVIRMFHIEVPDGFPSHETAVAPGFFSGGGGEPDLVPLHWEGGHRHM